MIWRNCDWETLRQGDTVTGRHCNPGCDGTNFLPGPWLGSDILRDRDWYQDRDHYWSGTETKTETVTGTETRTETSAGAMKNAPYGGCMFLYLLFPAFPWSK